jgi:hypothetical protein
VPSTVLARARDWRGGSGKEPGVVPLQFCSEQDTYTRSSLEAALQSFEDAFLALEAAEGSGYKEADKTWSHNPKNRIQGFPKDATDFQSDPSGVYRPPHPAQ